MLSCVFCHLHTVKVVDAHIKQDQRRCPEEGWLKESGKGT